MEPSSCPSLTKGEFRYDFGDTAGMTPLMKMYTLGNEFMPPSIHAGGLRYHGMAPTVSHLYDQKLIEAAAVPQEEVFEAGLKFANAARDYPRPRILPRHRAGHQEAQTGEKEGKKKVILFNLSGHGMLDLTAYDEYMNG